MKERAIFFVNSYNYKTAGVCASKIDFTLKDGKVEKIIFHSGCPGNLEGVSRLATGMDVHEVISKLKGISCAGKGTSCPDQLARALEAALLQSGKNS